MGRILGLDFGTRRVGLALSDPRRLIATPLEVYLRRSPAQDAAHFREIIAEEGVDRLVVGLPLHTGGGEGDLARLAREYGRWLAIETSLAVAYQDERYSSIEADEALRSSGLKSRDRKARRDMLAAQILLQAYLDGGCPTEERPNRPLDDEREGSS